MNYEPISTIKGRFIALGIAQTDLVKETGISLIDHVKRIISKELFDSIKISHDLVCEKIVEVEVSWDGVTTEYTFNEFRELIWPSS